MHLDLSHDLISQRAFAKWQARGCPEGNDQADWFAARRELERELMEEEANARFAERCRQVVSNIGHMHVASVAKARQGRRSSSLPPAASRGPRARPAAAARG